MQILFTFLPKINICSNADAVEATFGSSNMPIRPIVALKQAISKSGTDAAIGFSNMPIMAIVVIKSLINKSETDTASGFSNMAIMAILAIKRGNKMKKSTSVHSEPESVVPVGPIMRPRTMLYVPGSYPLNSSNLSDEAMMRRILEIPFGSFKKRKHGIQ